MGKLFDLESPVMIFLGKIADLMILNIITIIACIPIITIGPSLTAMHYVLLKMARKEDGYLFKPFVKSFKENFKHATVCWLIILLFIVIFMEDMQIINNAEIELAYGIKIALYVVGMIALMTIIYVFPILSRFENTVGGTLKNALLMSILNLPKTVIMLMLTCLPVVVIFVSINMVPVVFLLGISGPAYLCAMLYSGIFKRFEPEMAEAHADDTWFIKEEMEEEKRERAE